VCTCTPRAEKIFFLGQILQGNVSASLRQRVHTPPEAEQESNFLGNWGDVDGGRGYLGSFSVRFEGDDEKKVINFLEEENCTSQTKSWLRLCSTRRHLA